MKKIVLMMFMAAVWCGASAQQALPTAVGPDGSERKSGMGEGAAVQPRPVSRADVPMLIIEPYENGGAAKYVHGLEFTYGPDVYSWGAYFEISTGLIYNADAEAHSFEMVVALTDAAGNIKGQAASWNGVLDSYYGRYWYNIPVYLYFGNASAPAEGDTIRVLYRVDGSDEYYEAVAFGSSGSVGRVAIDPSSLLRSSMLLIYEKSSGVVTIAVPDEAECDVVNDRVGGSIMGTHATAGSGRIEIYTNGLSGTCTVKAGIAGVASTSFDIVL